MNDEGWILVAIEEGRERIGRSYSKLVCLPGRRGKAAAVT
jgi:hypothetical protein